MRKFVLVLITAFTALCLTGVAFAGSLAPGSSTTCKDAQSITLASAGSNATDRANANLVIWKSSNFTTIPITVGPSDTHGIPTGSAQGNHAVKKIKCKDTTQCVPGAVDTVPTGIREFSSKGRKSVTLTGQSNFSRGDSIGDISGEVRITNTGSVAANVTCG